MNTTRTTTRDAGYSLIELMVAMSLGLLISAGVITIFIDTKETQRTQDMLVDVQETGRAAIDILTYDLRMAGAAGLTYPLSPITVSTSAPPNISNDCFTTASQAFDWATALATTPSGEKSPAVYGEDDIGSDGTSKVFKCIKAKGNALPAQPDSDILSVHYTQPEPVKAADLKAAHLYARTSLSSAKIFQCPKGKSGTNCAPALPAGSEYHEIVSRVYYIRPWSISTSDGIPTLVRLDAGSGQIVGEPLIEGIRSLQITYGIDNDNDGYVDRFKTAAQMPALDSPAGLTSDWSKIKAVRVALLTESLSENHRNGPGNTTIDVAGQSVTVPRSKFARVFSFTVTVRNPRTRG